MTNTTSDIDAALKTLGIEETETARSPISLEADDPAVRESVDGISTLLCWKDKNNARARHQTVGLEFDRHHLALAGICGTGKNRLINQLWVAEWDKMPPAEILAKHVREFAGAGETSIDLVIGSPRGMVRNFSIPRVTSRRRLAAALWKGRQLVPFPLTEGNALYGFEFRPQGKDGWNVTLVALPRADAVPILDTIEQLGWKLRKVIMTGTQYFSCENGRKFPAKSNHNKDKEDTVDAVVMCSHRRASFGIFQNNRLHFHYDLGPLPGLTPGGSEDDLLLVMGGQGDWTGVLRSAVDDALNFASNANRALLPDRLCLLGIPESAAPQIAEWGENFTAGVAIVNPVREYTGTVSPEIGNWLETNPGLLTAAVLAATGISAVEITPAAIVLQHRQSRLLKLTRSVFLLSVAIAVVWTVFLWRQVAGVEQQTALFRDECATLQSSQPSIQAANTRNALVQRRNLLTGLQQPARKWMPWFKTALATLPENGSLTSAVLGPDSFGKFTAQFEGILSADGPPHPLTYRRWLEALAPLTTAGGTTLTKERSVEWKGRVRSVFTLELHPRNEYREGH